jgi:hypothetical protein
MTPLRTIGLVLGGALAGGALTFVVFRGHSAAPPAAAPDTLEASHAAPAEVDLRPRVAQAIGEAVQKVGAMRDEAAVRALLSELEQRARRQGVVTAMEIEPGLAAIETLEDAVGIDGVQLRQAEFAARMTALTRAQAKPAPAAQVPAVESIAREIERTPSAEARAQLVAQYVRAADLLPEDQREQAMGRLNQLAGKREAATPETILARLDATRAEGDRAVLVAELEGLIADRSEEEQRHYLEEAQRSRP